MDMSFLTEQYTMETMLETYGDKLVNQIKGALGLEAVYSYIAVRASFVNKNIKPSQKTIDQFNAVDDMISDHFHNL